MTTTPNMNLVLPDVSVTSGPEWATLLNAAMAVIDAHDHSSGDGVRITPSGLNISSDLEFNDNDATELRTTRYTNNTVFTPGVNDICCLYTKDDDLHYIDGQGNDIQLTLNGAIDFSGSITSLTLNDSAFFLQYFGDTTKKIQFSAVNINPSTTRIFSLPEPGSNDTLVTNNSTSVLTNKSLKDSTTSIVNISDVSKVLSFTLSAATASTSTSIAVSQSANRVITLPDATGTIVLKDTTDQLSNKSFITTTTIRSQNLLTFNNSANTFGTSLRAGSAVSNVTFSLPITDGANGQVIGTDGSGQLGFVSVPTSSANVAANDSNVVFTNSDNRHQICLPTAPRTYTLPTTSIPSGDTWDFDNRSAYLITLNSSGGNLVGYVPAYSQQRVEAVISTPTTAANWNFPTSATTFDHTDVTKQVLITASGNTTGVIQTIASAATVARTATLQDSSGTLPVSSYAAIATTATINAMSNLQDVAVFTGSTATALNGIAAGFLGQRMVLINAASGSGAVTISHSSASASVGDKIYLPGVTGTTILPAASSSVPSLSLVYTTFAGANYWVVESNSTNGLVGNLTGVAPILGCLGQEIVSAITSATNVTTTNIYQDGTSISVTAGCWDIYLQVSFILNGATCTLVSGGIGTASGTGTAGLVYGSTASDAPPPTAAWGSSICIVPLRVNLSATTSYYAKIVATFSAGNPQFRCKLRAVRVG